MPEVEVRPARPEDEDDAARLLFESSPELYERYAGSRERALAPLRAAFASEGNSASREIITLGAVPGGPDPAGAIAAFPVAESGKRGARLLRLSLRHIRPWTWPVALRIYRLGERQVPPPPPACFYIDSLATDPAGRRRGVATALLAASEERARELGLGALALETELDNTGAQALYERFGFEARARSRPAGAFPGFVAYVKRL
jgi:ribosomal protein S18 acetylase RimI-like enzyme